MPTQHGSPIYRGNRPFADAACVALTRAAGGVPILGKTVTTEFANRHRGEDRVPAATRRTPRRLVERVGRGGCRFPGAGGARHPDRRLDDPPGGVLRRHRLQADFGEFSGGIKMQCHNLDTSASCAAASTMRR